MKYVIDPTETFAGSCYTTLNDEGKCHYSGETIEQIKERNKNPNLIAISEEEMTKMCTDYVNELNKTGYVEVSRDHFYEMYECLPPKRNTHLNGMHMFFVGEPETFDLYPFCFSIDGRYFETIRRVWMKWGDLYDDALKHYNSVRSHESISKV